MTGKEYLRELKANIYDNVGLFVKDEGNELDVDKLAHHIITEILCDEYYCDDRKGISFHSILEPVKLDVSSDYEITLRPWISDYMIEKGRNAPFLVLENGLDFLLLEGYKRFRNEVLNKTIGDIAYFLIARNNISSEQEVTNSDILNISSKVLDFVSGDIFSRE